MPLPCTVWMLLQMGVLCGVASETTILVHRSYQRALYQPNSQLNLSEACHASRYKEATWWLNCHDGGFDDSWTALEEY